MTSPEIEEKLRKLAPLGRERSELAWRFYLSGESQERQETDDLLDILLFQQIQKGYQREIFLDPPPPGDCAGEYPFGVVLYPPGKPFSAFGLREDDWIKHILIVGMTGAGKTNLAFSLLAELRKRAKPFLVFDWKRNYRDLLQLPMMRDTKVFTVGREVVPFRFNPLIPPPGVSPGEWLMKLIDVLKHAYFVGEGVEYLLRVAIDEVYTECGLHDGSVKGTPLFYRVQEFIHQQRLQGRMSLWKASVLRVLGSLCFRHGLGPIVNTTHAFNPDLLQRPVILELDALADSDKIFLTEAIILWLYEHRKREDKREEFKHALIIEEAHHILSEKKERVEGIETIMETCLRQVREFGQAVIAIDQEPHKLSNSIKANTNCKITFNLGNGADIHDIAACLSLTPEERDYINLLTTGQAIAALKSRMGTPMLIAFPLVNVKKGSIADKELTP